MYVYICISDTLIRRAEVEYSHLANSRAELRTPPTARLIGRWGDQEEVSEEEVGAVRDDSAT